MTSIREQKIVFVLTSSVLIVVEMDRVQEKLYICSSLFDTCFGANRSEFTTSPYSMLIQIDFVFLYHGFFVINFVFFLYSYVYILG